MDIGYQSSETVSTLKDYRICYMIVYRKEILKQLGPLPWLPKEKDHYHVCGEK